MPFEALSSTLLTMGISAPESPAQAVSDVVLRDGSTMRFRPARIEDAPALLEFFRRLSDRSLYLRFHGHPAVDERLVEPLLDPDWIERGALVGIKADRIASLANYVRLRDVGIAEVAFAVSDELQGRGIATRMLERLAAIASLSGIEEFLAEVMPHNEAMLRVFAEAGFQTSRVTEGGTAEVRLRLASTETLVSRIDERDHVAVAASLDRSVASSFATFCVVSSSAPRTR
jgi:RimJ/RimL family protein N-acetyltransferase